jgi:protein-S-isoprenylcysteine O-methyltransferase Ste14
MIQRLRVPLGFALALVVVYLAAPTTRSFVSGLPLAAAGAVIRAFAAGTIRKDATLATDGMYAWTRNPLYLGSAVLTAGFALMSWSVAAAALMLAASLLIYPNVIRNEESHLTRLFPLEFSEYRSRVPRFFPSRLPSPKAWYRSFSIRQYLANREYNTAFGFVAVSALFLLKCRLI